jgi:hypothetical protein
MPATNIRLIKLGTLGRADSIQHEFLRFLAKPCGLLAVAKRLAVPTSLSKNVLFESAVVRLMTSTLDERPPWI